jgi:hypothetical protein
MSGKNFHLTPLETRKQLLLVESELNRVQLLNEIRALKNELGPLRQQLHAVGSLAASAAKLATTLSAVANIFSPRDKRGEAKESWFSTLLKGLQTGASLWETFKSQSK